MNEFDLKNNYGPKLVMRKLKDSNDSVDDGMVVKNLNVLACSDGKMTTQNDKFLAEKSHLYLF